MQRCHRVGDGTTSPATAAKDLVRNWSRDVSADLDQWTVPHPLSHSTQEQAASVYSWNECEFYRQHSQPTVKYRSEYEKIYVWSSRIQLSTAAAAAAAAVTRCNFVRLRRWSSAAARIHLQCSSQQLNSTVRCSRTVFVGVGGFYSPCTKWLTTLNEVL